MLPSFWKRNSEICATKPFWSGQLISNMAVGRVVTVGSFAGRSIQHSGGLQVEPAPDSGGLQVEPAPDSGGLDASLEAFSVKVEPPPDSGGLQAADAPPP